MSLTSFRQAVQQQLAVALGIEVLSGKIDQALPDRDVGCVWVAGVREYGSNVNVEEVIGKVRVFKQWEQTQAYQQGDIDELEALVETVQSALKAIGTAGPLWYFRVTEVELLIEEHGIEATLVGYEQNIAGLGG